MIRELRGTVTSVDPLGVVVDVSGWGVYVHLATSEHLATGNVVSLKTYLSFKQDGVDLYGFLSEEERSFFELLLTVPNVGPKTALSILRRGPRQALESAIASRDIDYLTRVAGLGKKAAEKIAVELSEKLGGRGDAHDESDADVFDTLVALGYTEREARSALCGIPKSAVGKDARLKAALSSASK
jgi:Holliday junction DNA helicase RuvA